MFEQTFQKRIEELDIIKCIAIILVMVGHTDMFSGSVEAYFALFHVGVFFICSGILYKNNIDSFGKYFSFVKKRIIRLYIPYVVTNLLAYIVECFVLHLDSFKLRKVILYFTLEDRNHFVGTTWFLAALLLVSLAYVTVDYVLSLFHLDYKYRKYVQVIVGIILLYGNFFYASHIRIQLQWLTSSYCLFALGVICKDYIEVLDKLCSRKRAVSYLTMSVAAFLSFFVLLYMSRIASISIGSNVIVNPIYFISANFVGFLLLFFATRILFVRIRWLKNLMTKIGKASLDLMLYHFVVWFVFNYLVTLYLGKGDWTLLNGFTKGNIFVSCIYISLTIVAICGARTCVKRVVSR